MKWRLTTRLKKAIADTLGYWQADLDEWRERVVIPSMRVPPTFRCDDWIGLGEEAQRLARETKGKDFCEWRHLDGDNENIWSQLCYEVADALFDSIPWEQEHAPWPILSAREIVTAITSITDCREEAELPREAPSPEVFLNTLDKMVCRLQERPFPVRFRLNLDLGKSAQLPSFVWPFKKNPYGIAEASGDYLDDPGDGGLYVKVVGFPSLGTCDAYARSLVETILAAVTVASASQCYSGRPHWQNPLGRLRAMEFDREMVSDGTADIQAPAIAQHSNREYALPLQLSSFDTKRLEWLLKKSVFAPPVPLTATNPEAILADVARRGIWRLGECSRLSAGPLAIGGYAAIFERAAAALLLDGKKLHPGAKLAEMLALRLKLSELAEKRLRDLMEFRNVVLHELGCFAAGPHVRKMWRLAKAALHHLVAKASGILEPSSQPLLEGPQDGTKAGERPFPPLTEHEIPSLTIGKILEEDQPGIEV